MSGEGLFQDFTYFKEIKHIYEAKHTCGKLCTAHMLVFPFPISSGTSTAVHVGL